MGPGRRGISRHLTEEGALPICEQCNSSGNSKPINIHSSEDGSISFTISRMWDHKPFEEADCRYVYLALNAVGRSNWKLLPGKKPGLRAGFMAFTQTVSNAKSVPEGQGGEAHNRPFGGGWDIWSSMFCQGLCKRGFQPPTQLRGVGISSHGCKQGCFQPCIPGAGGLTKLWERPAGRPGKDVRKLPIL